MLQNRLPEVSADQKPEVASIFSDASPGWSICSLKAVKKIKIITVIIIIIVKPKE